VRLVAYVRVPPGDKAERLSEQEQGLLRWASEEGHQVVAVFRERHGGGRAVADRRDLHEALAYLAERRATGLLIERVEILGRTVPVQEAVLALVWWQGGQVLTSVTRGLPAGRDPARHTLRELAAALLRLEFGVASARGRQRRQRARSRGRHAGGAPAFGYRILDGRVTIEPDEQAVLDRIGELRRAGLSLRELARVLDAEGHRPKRAEYWHPESLRRILARADTPGSLRPPTNRRDGGS
jgi:DNA invertase Pin-like site-specific DNA recombinase